MSVAYTLRSLTIFKLKLHFDVQLISSKLVRSSFTSSSARFFQKTNAAHFPPFSKIHGVGHEKRDSKHAEVMT